MNTYKKGDKRYYHIISPYNITEKELIYWALKDDNDVNNIIFVYKRLLDGGTQYYIIQLWWSMINAGGINLPEKIKGLYEYIDNYI